MGLPLHRPSCLRLLIVEDDPAREQRLREWLPEDIKPVVATSAGKALGVIRLDRGRVYAGIVLDHDLQGRRAADSDLHMSGQDVVRAIVQYVSNDVPILVHSVNASQSAVMVSRLSGAGFGVSRIPMDHLTKESFQSWISYIRDVWKEFGEQ